MGEAHTEQTKLQTPREKLSVKERHQLARIGRRNARRIAKQKRGGYFGLAKAIANAR